jgi:hypothetical protein
MLQNYKAIYCGIFLFKKSILVNIFIAGAAASGINE